MQVGGAHRETCIPPLPPQGQDFRSPWGTYTAKSSLAETQPHSKASSGQLPVTFPVLGYKSPSASPVDGVPAAGLEGVTSGFRASFPNLHFYPSTASVSGRHLRAALGAWKGPGGQKVALLCFAQEAAAAAAAAKHGLLTCEELGLGIAWESVQGLGQALVEVPLLALREWPVWGGRLPQRLQRGCPPSPAPSTSLGSLPTPTPTPGVKPVGPACVGRQVLSRAGGGTLWRGGVENASGRGVATWPCGGETGKRIYSIQSEASERHRLRLGTVSSAPLQAGEAPCRFTGGISSECGGWGGSAGGGGLLRGPSEEGGLASSGVSQGKVGCASRQACSVGTSPPPLRGNRPSLRPPPGRPHLPLEPQHQPGQHRKSRCGEGVWKCTPVCPVGGAMAVMRAEGLLQVGGWSCSGPELLRLPAPNGKGRVCMCAWWWGIRGGAPTRPLGARTARRPV